MVCKIFQIESSDNIIFKLIVSFGIWNTVESFCILLNNINNITNILNEFPYNESPLLRREHANNWVHIACPRQKQLIIEYASYRDKDGRIEPYWESMPQYIYISYKTTSFPNCELLKEQEVHRERGRGKKQKKRRHKTKKLGNL